MNVRERVAHVLRDVRNLPTLPDVAVQLLDMGENPSASMREMALLMERDVALAARVLRLVNSPFFGMQREVTSIQQALMILGTENLRNLVLSGAMLDLFDREGAVGSFHRGEFWKHCIAVGTVSRIIALRKRAMNPQIAFTAGLIHDMGKLVIDRHLHPEFRQVMAIVDGESVIMLNAEERILGVSHAEIGQYLAARWNLPDVLREAVGFHHSPVQAGIAADMAAAVGVADYLARVLKVGAGGGPDPELPAAHLPLCGMDHEELHDIRTELAETLDEQISSYTTSG